VGGGQSLLEKGLQRGIGLRRNGRDEKKQTNESF